MISRKNLKWKFLWANAYGDTVRFNQNVASDFNLRLKGAICQRNELSER